MTTSTSPSPNWLRQVPNASILAAMVLGNTLPRPRSMKWIMKDLTLATMIQISI